MKLDLAGHVVLPGLINAHDHLEFNLFPTLGRGGYANATEWAIDIHHPGRSPVREQLRVPMRVRLWWGGLKNLLSGVTTVCHHNPYESVFDSDFPVRVVKRFAWAHSLEYDAGMITRFLKAPLTYPFVVHCGEGVDASARRELGVLDSFGILGPQTVLVHGVALTPSGVDLMRHRGASLVWCPTSNLTMLGRTVSRHVLRSGIPIALATDSAMSAPVDLLDELRVARRYLPAGRLYDMVTSVPAAILRLSSRDTWGDWIAVRSTSSKPGEALLNGAVTLVSVGGRIRLIAPDLAVQLPSEIRGRLQLLAVEGREPVLVDAPVDELRKTAEKHLGRKFRLAGKRVLA